MNFYLKFVQYTVISVCLPTGVIDDIINRFFSELKKSISIVLKACQCGHSDCDCYNIEIPRKENLSDDNLPPPPSLPPEARIRRDSIMVYHRQKSEELLRMSQASSMDNSTDGLPIEVLYSHDTGK